MTTTDSSLRDRLPRIALTPTNVLTGFLLFLSIITFMRIAYFALISTTTTTTSSTPSSSPAYMDVTSRGYRRQGHDSGIAHARAANEASPSPGRNMTLRPGTAFVGFSTITSPGGSLYIPNKKSHSSLRRPLLLDLGQDLHAQAVVELHTILPATEHGDGQDGPVGMPVHGTNTLNTTWAWMV
ncbi:hypothetical protein AAL_01603 [Moelleriella libera RCEF 2490]|uniref:Uncharacterized protein n=1 Tax=Moelleriella libera RCEF 2490 TaxID=1081109 RepID=A0A166UAL0_9HYPO|nr:hypothetical protein AAL_01603 [Moelleriella libera RCEF 2490]